MEFNGGELPQIVFGSVCFILFKGKPRAAQYCGHQVFPHTILLSPDLKNFCWKVCW